MGVLSAGVITWRVTPVTTGQLLAGLVCGMVVPALVGARRAETPRRIHLARAALQEDIIPWSERLAAERAWMGHAPAPS
ncbi:hypothetical protein AB0942_33885 [Streptomyces nodosus]|uniref:hypothetical protein n=1 Tax=Streptomyces nodosus TaxID=40318 RepID=UPI003454CF6B